MTRREFLRWAGAATVAGGALARRLPAADDGGKRPNILFCIADDWGWPHAGVYGDPVVETPTFDRIAREGVLFDRAFVASPSCTPSRNSILTGQMFYRLEEGANLWSTLKTKFPVYPLLLEKAGYQLGRWRKSWGPGSLNAGGYVDHHPVGPHYRGFDDFMKRRDTSKPFCFWLGTSDPHRPYKAGSGKAAGMDLAKVPVPEFWPDDPVVRSDIADYYFEVQRFDADVGKALKLLEEAGELDNTLVVMTGDHGMPFPRCKTNLYDMGARVPLAAMWPARVKPARRVEDFVSFTDLAPTFLEAGGVEVPDAVTGESLMKILAAEKSGRIDPARDAVIFGRERHTACQGPDDLRSYPARAIRTDRWLYIHNLKPDLWPAGSPELGFRDCDGGPTKSFILKNRDKPGMERYYDLCFAKRPAEELYDCEADPFQLKNLAEDPAHAETRKQLRARLDAYLKRTGDPRITGKPHVFDTLKYRMRDKRRR